MMVFRASGIVAMILFIPLLIVLGFFLAVIIPVLALLAAAAGIAALFITARGRKQFRGQRKEIDVKDYRIR